ncbi:hypothetical protein [Tahibacter harae]|uniref:Phasin protein n=1 Tax=Tahibacter harae TaxID=2963937 RepID=A0ABT1QP03_9GAMM|nr:hypothetical protein [Tahibacter harae]MCQ4163547.1 hypothetical protein [Tahibacter harae]
MARSTIAATTPAGALAPRTEIPCSPFAALFPAWLQPAAQCQREWLQFAMRRWRKDMDTLVQLACCGSAAELVCVQYEAAADAAADYLGDLHRQLANLEQAVRPRAYSVAAVHGG